MTKNKIISFVTMVGVATAMISPGLALALSGTGGQDGSGGIIIHDGTTPKPTTSGMPSMTPRVTPTPRPTESPRPSGTPSGTRTPEVRPSMPPGVVMTDKELKDMGQQQAEAMKADAKARLDELKAKVKEKTAAERAKNCEDRKANIAKRLADYVSFATKHKAVFDEVLAKVDAFKTSKNLTVPDGDALKAAATAAGNTAAQEIATLSSLNLTIDCTNTDTVATNLDAFRTETAKVRQTLLDYREAIRAYAKAVKAVAGAVEASPTPNVTPMAQ